MRIKVGILTISDRCYSGEAEDGSGHLLAEEVAKSDMDIVVKNIVADEVKEITRTLEDWCDVSKVDLILTTGGTGFTRRDVTPEATRSVVDKEAPGIATALITQSLKITPMAMVSRLVAGIRKSTLIINFPGSPKACRECFAVVSPVLKHSVAQLRENRESVLSEHRRMDSLGHSSDSKPQAMARSSLTVKKSKVKPTPPAFRSRVSPYKMVSIDEAMSSILTQVEFESVAEYINLKETKRLIGRVLASDIEVLGLPVGNISGNLSSSLFPMTSTHILKPKVAVPPFPASIKDGYAVIAEDGPGVREVLLHPSTAGSAPDAFEVKSGSCVRINTGAPLPKGANAVVQVEDTELVKHNEDGEELTISISKAPTVGQDIRAVGSDIQVGQPILCRGVHLGPIELGLMAAVGVETVPVLREPVVGLLSTGDELIEPGEAYREGKIFDSNKTTLIGLLQEQRVKTVDLGIARDDADQVYNRLAEGFEKAEVIVTTGGVSMGDKDLLKRVLEQDFEATIHFGRIDLKPGKPTTFATCSWRGTKKLVFALPGNPVSAFVTCLLFAVPALRLLSGHTLPQLSSSPDSSLFKCHKTIRVLLSVNEALTLDERPEFVRAVLEFTDSTPRAYLIRGSQRSSRLLSIKDANALVMLPKKSEARKEVEGQLCVEAILM